MDYLTAIAKTRHEILADNEEPQDILISLTIKPALLAECRPLSMYQQSAEDYEHLMGMRIEWTKAVSLTEPQIVIRTAKGDTRIVTMFRAGDEQEPT